MNLSLLYANMFEVPNTGIHIREQELDEIAPYVSEQISNLNNNTGDNKDKESVMTGWQTQPALIDDKFIEALKEKISFIQNSCEILFIIGIGGSYLGPKAVIESIHGKNYNLFLKPKIFFLGCDTDPDYLQQCIEYSENKSIGAVVISKSGTTTEPAIAFRIIRSLIEKKSGYNAKRYIITITDKNAGALRKLTDEKEYENFEIPENIGGRFSVLTPVGLVPIALAGIDIKAYAEGFRSIKPHCDSPEFFKNPSALYSALKFLAIQKGASAEYIVTNSSFFESNLSWVMQLEPESEGHFGHGIHVIPALFPRDLHSIGQIIQQGPRNLIEIAFKIIKARNDHEIPAFTSNIDDLDYLIKNNLKLNEINQLVVDGPLRAHFLSGVPNMTINIPEMTPFYLGQIHYLLEKATAITGYLMGHNPFIQPGVQFWKDQFFKLAGKDGFEEERNKYLEEKNNNNKTHFFSF